MILKESTWTRITQVILPGLVLFSALAYMHGPGYLAYFQKQYLAYSMPRDSLWGPIKYNVRLKADFVSEYGDDCQVYVLTNLEQSKDKSTNRQELVLVDKWNRIVDRQVATDVGAIRSTHLSPQDGYAMLEVIRSVPDNRRQSEILHYQVTAEQIAMVDSETFENAPEWDWHDGSPRPRHADDRGRGWDGRRHLTPEQLEEWNRRRQRWEERRREPSDVALTKQKRDEKVDQERAPRKKRTEDVSEAARSDNKKDVKRTRTMGSDNERLLDVSRLGRTGDKAAELVSAPR